MSGKAVPWWESRPPTWWDADGIERPKFVLRFWFEWRADTAFWPANDAAYERFGVGPIAPEQLPLTPETRRRVHACSEWHDQSLNWDYPPDPGPWREEECVRFNAAARALHAAAARELGAPYELVFAEPEAHEDPDLDAYLRDPRGFRRGTRTPEA
jgi:hypothetical protein